MKACILAGLIFAGVAIARAAEETFSRAVRAEDFVAAGLAKLSPEELARLDTLVRDYKSGALAAARREAQAAAKAQAEAEARAAKAEQARATAEAQAVAHRPGAAKADEPGLLAKARVLLTPGTRIDYATIESRIAGEFSGWRARTTFTLENGQVWQANGTEPYVTPPVANPAVKIAPGALGSFWMSIEGVRPRVKVVRVDNMK
jgi:hypothetical protein